MLGNMEGLDEIVQIGIRETYQTAENLLHNFINLGMGAFE